VSGAVLRYRVMAWVVGVVLAVNCLVAVPLQIAGHPGFGHVGWTLHGGLFILYVLATADLVLLRLRWPLWQGVLIGLSGTIPFLSPVAERWVTRRLPVAEPVG
jgi:integral membrane protein